MAMILTEKDFANSAPLSHSERYWLYNGGDCVTTREVEDVILPRALADPDVRRTLLFEEQCQGPAMTMMLRGAAFDEAACERAIKEWMAEEKKLTAECCQFIGGLWDATELRKGKCGNTGKPHYWSNGHRARLASARGELPPFEETADRDAKCLTCSADRTVAKDFNPLSSPNCIKLFYTILELPRQHSRKGERGVTADDEAIEHLCSTLEKESIDLDERVANPRVTERNRERYLAKLAQNSTCLGILRRVVSVRKAHKQVSFLRSRRSVDGRLRQSVNVGATETGRWSASKDPFREGTNFQNIADRSRNVIAADPGLWLAYADLEQAESTVVAYDAQCEADIQDHLAGDTHTALCKNLFPDLPWGSAPDREIAGMALPWKTEHDFRRVAKIVRHGTNIGMMGGSIGREAHTDAATGKRLRDRYFQRYPENLRRQNEIKAQIAHTGVLYTPLMRKRQFFGRLWEDDTQREGLAQTQQSTIADLLNLVLYRVWAELDTAPNLLNAPRPSDPNKVWLLAQIHDAILFLIRPHDIETLQRVIKLMEAPLLIHGRECKIAVEVAIGQNFRHFDPRKADTVGGIGKWHTEGQKIILHNTKEYLKCV